MNLDCVQFYLWSVGALSLPPDMESELEQFIDY